VVDVVAHGSSGSMNVGGKSSENSSWICRVCLDAGWGVEVGRGVNVSGAVRRDQSRTK